MQRSDNDAPSANAETFPLVGTRRHAAWRRSLGVATTKVGASAVGISAARHNGTHEGERAVGIEAVEPRRACRAARSAFAVKMKVVRP